MKLKWKCICVKKNIKQIYKQTVLEKIKNFDTGEVI